MGSVERLRELMKERKVSQRRLGKLCAEIAAPDADQWRLTIGRWLRGKNAPSDANLRVAAQALGVDEDELLLSDRTAAEVRRLEVRLVEVERDAEATRRALDEALATIAKQAAHQRIPPEQPKHGSRTQRDPRG